MNKYEISVWRDVFSPTEDKWLEERLAVIGSDTMTTQARAREPKLVSNINGTNTFSFSVYYSYIDTETGEKIRNPFLPFLINERKIKVHWKDKWYDFLIKDIKEDSVNHIFNYTCEDLYLTELSRSGFNLEFNSVLQNNIGTPEELVNAVIENTDWQFDSEGSDKIYQITEEAVYEVNASSDFTANLNPAPEEGSTTANITNGIELLVFYSCAPAAKADALKTNLQFVYAKDGSWQQDDNDMLVLNGQCCSVEVIWAINDNTATAYIDKQAILTINFSSGVSKNYRAERYVDSQKTVFSPVVNRYVDVYTKEGQTIYGYSTTEFNDAMSVVNLLTNPSNFTNASGWKKSDEDENGLLFRLYPAFNKDTDITTYEAKSYLRICQGYSYENSGIQNNRSYIKNGFAVGDTYICRYKCMGDSAGVPSGAFVAPNLSPTIEGYFTTEFIENKDNWCEYRLTCITPCAFDELLTIGSRPVFSISANGDYWIEEIQFFKEAEGEKLNPETGEIESVRINPNEMDIQSVAKQVYRFFDSETEATSIDELEFISGEGAQPVMNGFQRFGTIEASNSNRFNILQSIAEAFECWVRFDVRHDETGTITGKYIQLKREIGQESGLTFVYGIDLQGVVRNLTSSQISTKTIVLSNNNEFGKNGFCTIARSEQNYPRENVIYNFDYYIQQGLLDKDTIQEDLQQYYDVLHDTNVAYMANLEVLTQKKNDLVKQTAQQTIYDQYYSSAEQELISTQDDLIKLAGVSKLEEAIAYAREHLNNSRVQALINDMAYIKNNIAVYGSLRDSIGKSIDLLQSTIDEIESEQTGYINILTNANTEFYKKYARFIQEGTWTSEDYYNDDLYYLDALQVAYESSRPQITYTINVLRVSDTIDFSSKQFNLADIAYIQDTEYFGYKDEFTPYKEKVFLSEITSYFDSPERDQLKVQNYLTQFDDLFQRITAATQNLEFSQGKYAKAANIVATDGTIKASVIQDTFNSNANLVYGAQNESATIDNTGITVTSNDDGSHLVRVTSGGIFVSADGGETWKNAIRGDGITTDLLTAGRINTTEINIYNTDVPSFRWDSVGISAYRQKTDASGIVSTDTSKFVRFDQYGIYGMHWTGEEEFQPTEIQNIYDNADFGLTWEKFFIKSNSEYGSVEISSENDIKIQAAKRDESGKPIEGQWIERVRIGRLDTAGEYGLQVRDNNNEIAFLCNSEEATISGWEITQSGLKSKEVNNQYLQIGADGSIGCYGGDATTQKEVAYLTSTRASFKTINLTSGEEYTFNPGEQFYVFNNTIRQFTSTYKVAGLHNSSYDHPTNYWLKERNLLPTPSNTINIGIPYSSDITNPECFNYRVIENPAEGQIIEWTVNFANSSYQEELIDSTLPRSEDNVLTTYTYYFNFSATLSGQTIFTVLYSTTQRELNRYIPKATNAWTIDNQGNAIFHNLFADGGQVAGWYIDSERIYQTWDGTPNIGENGSNIKSELNSSGTANRDGIDYSVVTDAINAAMANIGGVLMAGGLINGYNIAELMSKIQGTTNRISRLESRFNGHTHSLRWSSRILYAARSAGGEVNESFTGPLSPTNGPNK